MLERRKKCPNCNERVRRKFQNKTDGVGLCVHCDVVYGLYEHRDLRTNELATAPDLISYFESGDTLYITMNDVAENSKILYKIAFVIVSIPVFLIAFVFLILGEFLQIFTFSIFLIPFSIWCLFGFLIYLYPAYWERVDTYEFSVNPLRFDIYYTKDKWWERKQNIYSVSPVFIEQLFVSTNSRTHTTRRNGKVVKQSTEYFHSLRVRQKDYSENVILTSTNRKGVAFLEKTIEYYLGIDDRKVSDEEYLEYPLN